MKTVYRISIILNILFAGYILIRGSELLIKDYLFQTERTIERTAESTPQTTEVSVQEDKVTCDTIYTVCEYDLSTSRQEVRVESLPTSFIGMTRVQLVEWIDDYNISASLEDLEAGFQSMELLSFSPQEIRVRKRVESNPEPKTEPEVPTVCYYGENEEPEATVSANTATYYGCILAQDGLLTVYDGQRRHAILYTDISLFSLPIDIQQEILEGKYVTSEEELYNLLESYSS